jgi:UDP-2-acetamido-3-amino-2,3-dideoxy-glucuronate N-acetyltransferase
MIIPADIISGEKRIKLLNGAVINRYSHVVAGADIGKNAMIGSFCYIAAGAKIGKNTRIQNHNSLWDGVTLGNDVFIGPACNFTNEHDPRARFNRESDFIPDETLVGDNATICTNVTLICPVEVGENAFIGASATILKNVSDGEKIGINIVSRELK